MIILCSSYSSSSSSDATTFTIYASSAPCSPNGFRITSPSSEQNPWYMVGVTDKQAASTERIEYVYGYSRREKRLPSGGWFALNCQGFLVTGKGAVFALHYKDLEAKKTEPLVAGNPAIMNGSIFGIKHGDVIVSCYLPSIFSKKHAIKSLHFTTIQIFGH
jgi:hypothetical protein